MDTRHPDPVEMAEKGLALCRDGDLKEGIRYLSYAVEQGVEQMENCGVVYSYLGYGIAQTRARYKEGLELCLRSVTMQVYEPENYLNLARVYVLRKQFTEAFKAIDRGLGFDSRHLALRRLRRQIDRRRPPVLRFLSPKHPVNRFLGRARHQIVEGMEGFEAAGERRMRGWLGRMASWRLRR